MIPKNTMIPTPKLKGLSAFKATLDRILAKLEFNQAILAEAGNRQGTRVRNDLSQYLNRTAFDDLVRVSSDFEAWRQRAEPIKPKPRFQQKPFVRSKLTPDVIGAAFIHLQEIANRWQSREAFTARDGLLTTTTYNRLVKQTLAAEQTILKRMNGHGLHNQSHIEVFDAYKVFTGFQSACLALDEAWRTLLEADGSATETALFTEPVTKEDVSILADYLSYLLSQWRTLSSEFDELLDRLVLNGQSPPL